jgi:hypothetical protein
MFCGECGYRNQDTSAYCRNCGKPLKKPHVAVPAQPVTPPIKDIPAATPMVLAVPVTTKKTDRVVIYSSIICGIASFFFIPYVLAIMAIALGFFSVYKKDRLGVMGIAIGVVAIIIDYGYANLLSYCAV